MGDRLNAHTGHVDWKKFISAVDKIHGVGTGVPRFRDFVTVHVRAMSTEGMPWGVHTMSMGGATMPGRNFLAWHRWLLVRFERRLQSFDATVTIPYWDAIGHPTIPAPLQDGKLLTRWGITRKWTPAELPGSKAVSELNNLKVFGSFQTLLELDYHNSVHRAVGGDMATSASPNDIVFWLHHANIDRLWSRWQAKHSSAKPTNPTEKLRPSKMFGIAVDSVLDAGALGYRYR